MQIAVAALAPDRPHGMITALATTHAVSRQTIYARAARAGATLAPGMAPQPYGPLPTAPLFRVDRNRLRRATGRRPPAGVRQRDLCACLDEVLDTSRSPAWVHATLERLEQAAATVTAPWQPTVAAGLAGDARCSHGQPTLLVVGTETLFFSTLTRQPTRAGATGGCVLLVTPAPPQCASAAGTGLAALVQDDGVAIQHLDWDHRLRPRWGQVTRLERQASAARQALEDRAAQVDRARGAARLAQHLAAWERLGRAATAAITRYDAVAVWARQVDDWVRLIDLATGPVRDADAGGAALQQLSHALADWPGRGYARLAGMVRDWASGLCAAVRVLQAAHKPLRAEWGVEAVASLGQLWQGDADRRRHPLPWPDRQVKHQHSSAARSRAVAVLGAAALAAAWTAVSAVLGRAWRGSMLAECSTRRVRPRLDQRKQSDQGMLELWRLLHTVRPQLRGRRAGQSPAEAAGIALPDDPRTLLGLEPKGSI